MNSDAERSSMNLIYVTKELPFGAAETFIYPEIFEHQAHGCRVTVVPVRRTRLVHESGRRLLGDTLARGLLDGEILRAFVAEALCRPIEVARVLLSTLDFGKPMLIPRNVAVWAKGVWLARQVARLRADHIHVHWIAVPATLALIASRLSGVPMSVTAHRYDIAQGNLIAEKMAASRFVRAIDGPGARELEAQMVPGQAPPVIIRMGVDLACDLAPQREGPLTRLRALVGARYVAKKGHATLLKAIAEARQRGVEVELDAYGDGPLLEPLQKLRRELGLEDLVRLNDVLSHTELLAKLRGGGFDVGVLPSVTAKDGDKEGIPVFLMEAMSVGLPVVSTPNGGIVELIHEGSGILVPEYDATALADALVRLARDPQLRSRLAAAGRQRIVDEFSIRSCAAKLRRLFADEEPLVSLLASAHDMTEAK